MHLGQILQNIGKDYKKIEFRGINFDSKKIKKGDIFFAIKGNKTSGIKFIRDVVKKKASAIITDQKVKKSNFDIPMIKVKNVRKSLSEACSNFYKHKPKNLLAITGTNGKSSVANFFYQILSLNKIPSASIGTLGIQTKKFKRKTFLTSINPLLLHKNLSSLVKKKIQHVIIEASSHGLHQNRLDFLKFKTAIFTNLSHDHLDYHKTMKNYLNSKMYLFNSLLNKSSKVITDQNNKEFYKLKKICNKKKLKLETIGFANSNLKILNHNYQGKNQIIKLSFKSKIYHLKIPLIGFIQCKNLLMSILAAHSIGIKFEKIIKIIEKLKPVDGRLECITELNNNSKIILDFAHTPDALEQTLKAIKEHFRKNISIIFGCGGERDKNKRPIMGDIAKKYCKKIYITDDNPRTENPSKIRKSIIRQRNKCIEEIPNRKKAIIKGIKDLKSNEILLVAGKGHESVQDYGKIKIKFSDKEVIKKIVKKRKKELKNYSWKFDILKNSLKKSNINKFKFNKISINSNQIKKNNLFVAIKGKKNNGHSFVKVALSKGASRSIVSNKIKNVPNFRQIKVANTLNALKKIGFVTRQFSNSKVIGITGSTGKTTLKSLLAFALNKFSKVYSSPKSYNNHYGVPLSLSNLQKDTEYGIFEIGMNKKGEIDRLSKIVRPNIGVITNIAEAHVGHFDGIFEIAKAKSEIMNNISEYGHVILNKDDHFFNFLNKVARSKKLKVVTFGLKNNANVYLKKIIKRGEIFNLIININNKDYQFHVNYNFENFILNLLAAISVFNILNINLENLKKIFLNFSFPEGRGDISKISLYKKKITFINESYNANPLSMRSALKNFHLYKNKYGEKIIFLSDMLELGSKSKKYHRQLAKQINKSNIDRVYVWGNDIKQTFKYIKQEKKGEIFQDSNNIFKVLKKDIKNNAALMIKGSNSTGLFELSKKIKKGIPNVI